jgi:hypothetical protein
MLALVSMQRVEELKMTYMKIKKQARGEIPMCLC